MGKVKQVIITSIVIVKHVFLLTLLKLRIIHRPPDDPYERDITETIKPYAEDFVMQAREWGIELDFTQRSLCEDVDKIIVIIRSDYLKKYKESDEIR